MSERALEAGRATARLTAAQLDALLEERAYGTVLGLGPQDVEATRSRLSYYRGVALLLSGRPAEALPELAEAVAEPDREFWASHWSGRAHEALGDPASAAEAFWRADQHWPEPDNAKAFRDACLTALAAPDLDPERRARLCAQLKLMLERDASPPSGSVDGERQGAHWRRLGQALASLEERQRDLDLLLRGPDGWPPPFKLETRHPVALASDDHRQPRGAINDNTRSPRFVGACERLVGGPLHALDLGCAGGGLVRDFLLAGHRALGLEGSDASLLDRRAEWRTIPRHLRTCDLTQPFHVSDEDGRTAAFDVITAWEVLEHLPASTLPVVFGNVRDHLGPEGLFVASVAQFEDFDQETGAVWHVTLQPSDWWFEQVRAAGLAPVVPPFRVRDFVRGSGNGPDDWNIVTDPELGFHLAAALPGSRWAREHSLPRPDPDRAPPAR